MNFCHASFQQCLQQIRTFSEICRITLWTYICMLAPPTHITWGGMKRRESIETRFRTLPRWCKRRLESFPAHKQAYTRFRILPRWRKRRPWFYLALLDSTTQYHGSTWLYNTPPWLYLALLDSTTLYHGSTPLYHSSTWQYICLLYTSPSPRD